MENTPIQDNAPKASSEEVTIRSQNDTPEQPEAIPGIIPEFGIVRSAIHTFGEVIFSRKQRSQRGHDPLSARPWDTDSDNH